MKYCILNDGIIANIIVCDNDETAALFGAVIGYDTAKIGDTYSPPPSPEPEPAPEPEPTEMEVLQAQVAELQAELLRLRTGG